MTSLLILFVLVLIGVAVWQLTKIFDLTQVGVASDDSGIANDKDNNINGYLMFGFLAFIYIFTLYSLVEWGEFILGTPASQHGVEVDNLMAISMYLIFFVQTITQFLLHYFAFKYRGKQGQKALYFADSNKLEAIWTIIPVIVLSALILYGLFTWNNIMFVDEDEEDVMIIELYAKQFGWEARYSGEDNTLGKSNVRLIEGINTLGVDLDDPAAKDDKVVTELHLPKGKKIVFKIRSQDVLHSAYMPHFRAQMNCVPGMITQFAFVPTVTTTDMRNDKAIDFKVKKINKIREEKSKELVKNGDEALEPYEFDYLLLCNKICGASHYNMQMKIIVDTPEDFKSWYRKQPKLYNQWKDANKAAVQTEVQIKAVDSTLVDSTKVIAQIIK